MEDHPERRRRHMNNTYKGDRRERLPRHDDNPPYNPRFRSRYESPPRHSPRDTYHVMNELKDMLSDVLAQQGRRRR